MGSYSNDIAVIGDVNQTKMVLTLVLGFLLRMKRMFYYGIMMFIVLPWHFRDFFLKNPKFKGKRFLFPLPEPEVVIAQ